MIKTEAAWLAGVIDGDGCITMCPRGKTVAGRKRLRAPIITLDSTDEEIVRAIKTICGGRIVTRKTKQNPSHRKIWSWRISGALQLLAVLKEIRPYMRCPAKRSRADILLTRWASVVKPNGNYSPSERDDRERLEVDFFNIGKGRGSRRRGSLSL